MSGKTAWPHWILALIISGVFWVMPVCAQSPDALRKPLLISGKRTIYQRVITHPGARLFPTPSMQVTALPPRLKPFSVFYVYDRKRVGKDTWVEAGISAVAGPQGWIRADKTSAWKQALTLMFTERTGREPVLFFKDLASLDKAAASNDPALEVERLAGQFNALLTEKKAPTVAFPLVALEPTGEAIARDRFYLMPIFQAKEIYEGVKFLEVASIDPGSGWLPDGETELRTGIAFVIDTTISMRPYFERIRGAVRRIYNKIESAGLADKVAFGLVAFRNSVERTPALEYVSRVVSDLRDGRERAAFEAALDTLQEARVSTHSFNEDAFAGLKLALEQLNWGPYLSRMIFLITDAGAIRNDDPYSTTGMNEAEIADLADATGVKIFALHLKTPAGTSGRGNNHAYAESQYRVLTGQSDTRIGDLYVPIDATRTQAGVATFGNVIENVADKMVELVWATGAGDRLTLPGASADASGVTAEAIRKAAILGYAMQLDFLGRRDRIQAPQVVTSWVADVDLARPDTPAFKVTVMLSKNQLSDLHQRLKIILDEAQRTKRTGARDFFQSILSAAAQTSRDPNRFSRNPDQNLGQLGILAEFLDDLPYRSGIMRLTEEDWYRLSVGEQQALINGIKSKLRRYEAYHNDTANWVDFGANDPGEAVYRVPLSAMP